MNKRCERQVGDIGEEVSSTDLVTITLNGMLEDYNMFIKLLRRKIPMAWGTTTDNLTPEINPFQYAIEIKCLTLKDQTTYLISDS